MGQYCYVKSNAFGIHALGSAPLPLLQASLELVSCPAKHMTKLETCGYPEIFSPLTGFSSFAKGRCYKSDKLGWGEPLPHCFWLKTAEQTQQRQLACCHYAEASVWLAWMFTPHILPQMPQTLITCHISSWMTCTFSSFLSIRLSEGQPKPSDISTEVWPLLKFEHCWEVCVQLVASSWNAILSIS